MKRFLIVVSLLLAFIGTSYAGGGQASVEMPLPATLSDSLPWFAVRKLDDANSGFTRDDLAKLANGANRVAIVYFATWCAPCLAGVKSLKAKASELKKNRTRVVLVNVGEDADLVSAWLKEKIGPVKFRVIMDPFKRLTEGFGLVKEGQNISLPRTLVIDSQLKPLFMLGEEGSDWPQVLWEK